MDVKSACSIFESHPGDGFSVFCSESSFFHLMESQTDMSPKKPSVTLHTDFNETEKPRNQSDVGLYSSLHL